MATLAIKQKDISYIKNIKISLCNLCLLFFMYIFYAVSYLSVDNIESGIFAQALGHYDTFGCLVVFEQCSHNTGQCESRTVESMAEMSLLVIATVTAFETVGLICFEVRYRRNLEPAFLSSRPYFEVESDSRGKAHVATAETKYMPRKSELFE